MLSLLDKPDLYFETTQPLTWQVHNNNQLLIQSGALQITFDQSCSIFTNLLRFFSKAPVTGQQLKKYLSKINNDQINPQAFILALLDTGILYWRKQGETSLKYHRASCFGYFQELAHDRKLINRLNKINHALQSDYPHATCHRTRTLCSRNPHLTFSELLQKRKSWRSFNKIIEKTHVNYLMWSGYGLLGRSHSRRTVPSAGAIYPLRLYFVSQDILSLNTGIYRYCPHCNLLIKNINRSIPDDLSTWFRTQHINYQRVKGVIFIACYFHAVLNKYGDRGYRYALLEAGHVAQNICLAAAAENIKSIPLGGFDDDQVNLGLGIACRGEKVVYSIVIG